MCPYDTNGDGDCASCSKPGFVCNGMHPIRTPIYEVRTVPRVMLDLGFAPQWIWDEMRRSLLDRFQMTPGRAKPMDMQIHPNQQADVMVWTLTYS